MDEDVKKSLAEVFPSDVGLEVISSSTDNERKAVYIDEVYALIFGSKLTSSLDRELM